jgi:hypothetical protein
MALLLNWRVWLAIALAGLLAFSHLTVYRAGRHAVQSSWDAAKVAQQAEVQAQADKNREQSRMAELHLSAITTQQDKFFTKASKEIHDASAPLAACTLPIPVRVQLNSAAACARSDSPTSDCGADEVPDTR